MSSERTIKKLFSRERAFGSVDRRKTEDAGVEKDDTFKDYLR